jgi:hypothetical protein
MLFTLTVVFCIDISRKVYANALFTYIVFPTVKGFSESVDFSNSFPVYYSFNFIYIIITFFLPVIIEIASIIFIFRKIKSVGILKTFIFFIIFQVLIFLFILIVFTATYQLNLEILTFNAGRHVRSEASYKSILKERVISDPIEIHNAIKSLNLRPDLSISPYLFNISSKAKKTAFEAYVIPRYVYYYPSPKEFREYDNLPYYFVAPNHFVIHNADAFFSEFGIELVKKIISSKYPEYILENNPELTIGQPPVAKQAEKGSFDYQAQGQYEPLPTPHITVKKTFPYIKNMEIPLYFLTHEYLHYLSEPSNYSPMAIQFPYLNEALTDYFAVKILGTDEELQTIAPNSNPRPQMTTYSYSMHIKVIELLSKRIPAPELEKIYFTQNNLLFKEDFNKYFPNSDYLDFMATFNELNNYYMSTANIPYTEYDKTFNIKISKILNIQN